MLKKEKFNFVSEKVGSLFSKLQIPPNYFTFASIFFAILCFLFLIKNNLVLASLSFVFASVLDFIDGAVARFTGQVTKLGAYLDTVFDRYVEAIFLFGFLFLPLPKIYLGPTIWIFLALFGSLMTTYSKAAGKEKEILEGELKKRAFLERPERLFLIFLALILGVFSPSLIIYPIIALALLSNITAIQRIWLIVFTR